MLGLFYAFLLIKLKQLVELNILWRIEPRKMVEEELKIFNSTWNHSMDMNCNSALFPQVPLNFLNKLASCWKIIELSIVEIIEIWVNIFYLQVAVEHERIMLLKPDTTDRLNQEWPPYKFLVSVFLDFSNSFQNFKRLNLGKIIFICRCLITFWWACWRVQSIGNIIKDKLFLRKWILK